MLGKGEGGACRPDQAERGACTDVGGQGGKCKGNRAMLSTSRPAAVPPPPPPKTTERSGRPPPDHHLRPTTAADLLRPLNAGRSAGARRTAPAARRIAGGVGRPTGRASGRRPGPDLPHDRPGGVRGQRAPGDETGRGPVPLGPRRWEGGCVGDGPRRGGGGRKRRHATQQDRVGKE